jgi:hypothetical protein
MRPFHHRAQIRRTLPEMTRELWWAVGGAVGGALVLAVTVIACGPPPIGWQGAGRLQTLPSPETDSSAPSMMGTPDTSGDDTGTGGDDSGGDDTGLDSGDDSGEDSGVDGGQGTDAHDSGPADAGAEAG